MSLPCAQDSSQGCRHQGPTHMCIVGIRVQRLPAVWEYPQCRLGWDLQHKLGALGLRPRQMWLQWQMVLSGKWGGSGQK